MVAQVDKLTCTDFYGPGGASSSRLSSKKFRPTPLFATVVLRWPGRSTKGGTLSLSTTTAASGKIRNPPRATGGAGGKIRNHLPADGEAGYSFRKISSGCPETGSHPDIGRWRRAGEQCGGTRRRWLAPVSRYRLRQSVRSGPERGWRPRQWERRSPPEPLRR